MNAKSNIATSVLFCALSFVVIAKPALADDDEWRHGRHGNHWGEREGWEHHHHRMDGRPMVVYAPQPMLYAQPVPVYQPSVAVYVPVQPSPSVVFSIPLNFR